MKKIIVLLTITMMALSSCGKDDDATKTPDSEETPVAQVDPQKVKEKQSALANNYADIVLKSYEDSLELAKKFQVKNNAFVAADAPTQAQLDELRTLWKEMREPYLQTEVYRFYNGPIDGEEHGSLEPLINAWPMDEGYVDYIHASDATGAAATFDNRDTDLFEKSLIGDENITLDENTIRGKNEGPGDFGSGEAEKNISTGYHAIEFVLWGQDLNEKGREELAGNRDIGDFDKSNTERKPQRRKQYLKIVTDMLVKDLEKLVEAWKKDSENYRKEFLALDPNESFYNIMTGVRLLTGFETGSERVSAAYETKNQEEEHSCFSDNTHRDMIQDIQGVVNVLHGTYTALDGTTITGTGVLDVIKLKDADLADQIDKLMDDTLTAAKKMGMAESGKPFDVMITEDDQRPKVKAFSDAIGKADDELKKVFNLFGKEQPPED